jgi:hypothetical protein
VVRRALRPAQASLLLVAVATIAFLLLASPPGLADPAPRPGVVILLIEDRVSFEELMAVPGFRQLARSGGAALMATDQTYRSNPREVYLALGSGAGPRSAVPQLLARTLGRSGVATCLVLEATEGPVSPEQAALDRLLGFRQSSDCARARTSPSALFVMTNPALFELDEESGGLPAPTVASRRRAILDREGGVPGDLIRAFASGKRALVMVVTPSPSAAMNRTGDEVTPLVTAQGPADRLLRTGAGPVHALTSDTTRRDGLVANIDVAPTVLQFFGLPIPAEMAGEPIHVGGQVDLFALHRLHLEQRHIRLPVQLAELGFVAVLALLGIPLMVAVAVRGGLPLRVAAAMRYAALCGAAFGTVLLGGGLLPRLTWAVVIPYLVVATAGLGALSLTWRDRGPFGPFVFLGALGLAFIVVDGVLGGRAFAVPLIGGTMFDGVRYYGLPNAFISVLLASALFVAAALGPVTGSLVLIGAGLFAGFPHLGADVGGAITLFAAAGLWWGMRTAGPRSPGGPRWRAVIQPAAAMVAFVVAGLAVVLLVNRFLPGAPTHATRFVELAQSRSGKALSEVRHRLGVGWHMLNSVPAAYIPLGGLAAALGLTFARPGPIGRGLSIDPRWWDVLVVMVVSAAVAFAANDTGVAAAAPAFLYAMTLLAYATLLPSAWAHPPAPSADRPERQRLTVP